MRILLDHCLPRRLNKLLAPHQVVTAGEMGWERLRNGELLALASLQFDLFLTIDKKIKKEQKLDELPLAVFVIMSHSNRIEDVSRFIPAILGAIDLLIPRKLVEIKEAR